MFFKSPMVKIRNFLPLLERVEEGDHLLEVEDVVVLCLLALQTEAPNSEPDQQVLLDRLDLLHPLDT